MIAHGAVYFLKERLFDQSDAYKVHVCERCGLIAIGNLKKNSLNVKAVRTRLMSCQSFSLILIVWLWRHFLCRFMFHMHASFIFQELMSMTISPKMLTGDVKVNLAKDLKKGAWDARSVLKPLITEYRNWNCYIVRRVPTKYLKITVDFHFLSLKRILIWFLVWIWFWVPQNNIVNSFFY